MIHRLFLDNYFTHQNKTFTFEKGLTGIIGPNESGKSLIMEGVRFALFGTAAMRASVPTDIHVELDFLDYTVVRKGRNAKLSKGDEQIAVGVKPVNEAITRILGYDMAVFDIANACNQNQVEALTAMRPAERKAMVDRTVGLDTLDVVIKHCGDMGNALKNEAAGIRRALVEPEIVLPWFGRPSAEIPLAQAQADLNEFNRLTGETSGMVEPVGTARPVVELQQLRADAKAALTEFNQLTGYLSQAPAVPTAPADCPITDDVAAYEADRLQVQRTLAELVKTRGALTPEPFDSNQLDALVAQHDQFDLWTERQRLLAQGHLCCPACNHSWPIAGNIPEAVETSAPSLSRREIAGARALIGNSARIADLDEAITALVVPADRSADLRTRQTYDAAFAAFNRAMEAYREYNQGIDAKRGRHAELAGSAALVEALGVEHDLAVQLARWADAEPKRQRLAVLVDAGQVLADLRAEYESAVTAETNRSQYEVALTAYETATALHLEIATKSEVYLKARMDIYDLKVQIKTHLLPSLNKVASHLLTQMTGGERSLVAIDEDFDIQIDGTPVQTLSGSGKAVANLAIRIALGQILTNRVFSIFMADEVDGSMDDDRSEYVAQALRRLTGVVSQVILITHKRPETDHMIELKK